MPDTASAVVRWAAFSCVLVPVVLLWYGTSLAGAAGTALGLAAVTGACRVLLRQSERGAAQLRAEERAPQRGRHVRDSAGVTGGAHVRDSAGVMGGAHGRGGAGVMGTGRGRSGAGAAGGAHARSGAGAHRGGRHGGGNKPVD
ncbi:hypothetical protein [Streptomyces sp. R41]|uniref:Uncharacterized protein n=1 Tax=Streptomyces sp. R41 TaxID=3238632 RepID=A0AB39RXS2_9ACTN